MATQQSFEFELYALTRTLEQACKRLASLKHLHEVEMHSAMSEVTAKAQKLMLDQPVMALPHQMMDTEGLKEASLDDMPPLSEQIELLCKQTSTQSKMEKYLPRAEGEAYQRQVLCVLPLADVRDKAPEANAASEALVVLKSCIRSMPSGVTFEETQSPQALPNISSQASKVTFETTNTPRDRSKSAPGRRQSQMAGFPVVAFDGRVREVWEDAKQDSVARLTARCTVQIHHHDDEEENDGVFGGRATRVDVIQRQPLSQRAHNAGVNCCERAVIVGQGTHDAIFVILNPIGIPRFVWNAMCLLFITYDLFLVPMQAFDLEGVTALEVFEWILTVWWTLDVYMTFRTGYVIGTRIEMRPQMIAKHYACTWLVCDVVIVIIEWINRIARAATSASIMRSQRLLRFFRIVRLLRIGKVSGFWKTLNDQVNSNVTILLLTLAILTGILILTLHITACIWYWVGGSRDDGWTAKDEYEGEQNQIFWYIAAMRYVIGQFNGRTDMDERRNMVERLFTCLCGILLAVIAQGFFISFITKALFDLSDVVSEKTRRKRAVNEYLEANPLSPILTSQVKRCVNDYHDVRKEMQKENDVLAILPNHLQQDVLEEVRAPVLMQHPFFHALPFESPAVMRLVCCNVVETISAAKDEKVFDKNDICERMLFTNKLTATYGEPSESSPSHTTTGIISSHSDPVCFVPQQIGLHDKTGFELLDCGKTLMIVKVGSWISEAALWVEWRNQGRCVCNAHGIMIAVSASRLAKGLKKHHPDAFSMAYLHGKNVALELSKQDPTELSDILPFEILLYSPLCVNVEVVSATGLRNADGIFTGKSDPYCICKVVGMAGKGGEARFKTKTINDTLDPVWNHSAEVHLSRHQLIEFHIFDYDFGKKDQELGLARLLPEDFANGFDGDLGLRNSDGTPALGSLRVKIQVLDKEPEAPPLLHLWPSRMKKKPSIGRSNTMARSSTMHRMLTRVSTTELDG